jgi:MarR family 2-MHQ and catechol resistance regulon transcriptional repressor
MATQSLSPELVEHAAAAFVPHPPPGGVLGTSLKLWIVLARAYESLAKHTADDVARHGLTIPEFGVLEVLYHKGPLLLREVQKRVLVSSGGTTFLIDRLVAKGLRAARLPSRSARPLCRADPRWRGPDRRHLPRARGAHRPGPERIVRHRAAGTDGGAQGAGEGCGRANGGRGAGRRCPRSPPSAHQDRHTGLMGREGACVASADPLISH